MAEKRMFTQKIIDSDAFLDMPLTTQALYFHLNMRADDDGFINNPKRIQRTIGASDDDLRLLIAKRFLICFDSGVIVIKHWRMHNTLKKDRYNPTQYQEELESLEIKDNKSYTEKKRDVLPATTWQPSGTKVEPKWNQNGTSLEPQYSIDKYSIDNNNILCANTKPTKSEVDAYFDKLWNMYPVKKGKGQVSESKRRALFSIGFDEMQRAIQRYLDELKKDASWRKPQNGSTFFNSGYIDYLDANFEPQENIAVSTASSNGISYCESEPDPEMDEFIRSIGGNSNG